MRIVSWVPQHDDALVGVLAGLWHARVGYPPARDVDGTETSLRGWLHADADQPGLTRWVAVDESGTPVGHVQVSVPHDYLTGHLPAALDGRVGEVGKLFAAPGARAGRRLLAVATRHLHQSGQVPALAVLPGATAARRLYTDTGWVQVSQFRGMHGLNYVLMHPSPDARVSTDVDTDVMPS